ncbi:MAG TPA: glycerophosphodiester phosphodiesterase [Caldilineae bacterium]|nr:glycerophosphodiester phosphodiesterase [Caldilineae bacterium]
MKRYLWRLTFMVIIVVVVFALYRRLTINPPSPTAFLESPYPLILAHRGGMALAPENTMLAFERALVAGADGLEIDVRASRDGELVVIHDETVDRTTNGTGRVADMTLAELKALDAGYRYSPDNGVTFPYRGQGLTIPTLREVLEAFPDTPINIEIKQTDPPIEEALANLIREMGAEEWVLVVSTEDEVIKRFRHLAPGVATGAATGEVTRFYWMQRLRLSSFYRPVAHVLQVPEEVDGTRIITPHFVEAAHAQGMKVIAWTVNMPDRMRELLRMGVDGIVTDRPDLLRQVRAEVTY